MKKYIVIIGLAFSFLFCFGSFLSDAQAKEEKSAAVNTTTKENANLFAEEIRKTVSEKDIKSFSKMISYPIFIYTSDGKKVKIRNKWALKRFGEDKLFTQEFTEQICKEPILYSWRGYMMGISPNLFFDEFKGKYKIYAISLEK